MFIMNFYLKETLNRRYHSSVENVSGHFRKANAFHPLRSRGYVPTTVANGDGEKEILNFINLKLAVLDSFPDTTKVGHF